MGVLHLGPVFLRSGGDSRDGSRSLRTAFEKERQ
jgi:hypothetical protein